MWSHSLKLTVAIAAITVILFGANVTITYAHQRQYQPQQQALLQLFLQQLLTSEPGTVENGTTTIQSTNDSFRVQVPQGWIIQDVDNSGVTLAAEVINGYGLVAQLCPAEQQQREALLVNASDNSNSCQGAQEVIHVIRYPNLGARLEFASDGDIITANNSDITPDTIVAFQMLKLQEVGYRDIRIISSMDTTIDVISSVLNNRVIATVPAKLVEITYGTNLVSNETRTGYFLSTATNLTPRNLGMVTGYGIFYERNPTIAPEPTTTASTALSPPAPVIQVFDSFELLAAPEVGQALVAELYQLVAQTAQTTDLLTVEIDSSGTEGIAPAAFVFEADITGGREPYTISWDLDDDGIAESNEQTLAVTFNEAGTYDIVLTVADIEGQIASDTVEITVEEGKGGEEEASTEEEEKEEESLTEEMTHEQNSCDPLYPITCIPSFGSGSLLDLYGLGSP